MFFNLAKVFQKSIVVLAVVMCLIIMENFLNKFLDNNANDHENSIVRESSIIALEQQQAVESVNDNNVNNNNNIDVAVAISSTDDSQMSEAAVILLWWTPFIGEMEYTKNCGNSVCFFTGNHKFLNHEKLKVILIRWHEHCAVSNFLYDWFVLPADTIVLWQQHK